MSDEKEVPTPQAASGKPDGTVPPTGIPIEVFTQKLSIPDPQSGEEIRAALEQYEGDAIIRDPQTKAWVYIRTRVFVDLKAKEATDAQSPIILRDSPNDSGGGNPSPDGGADGHDEPNRS